MGENLVETITVGWRTQQALAEFRVQGDRAIPPAEVKLTSYINRFFKSIGGEYIAKERAYRLAGLDSGSIYSLISDHIDWQHIE